MKEKEDAGVPEIFNLYYREHPIELREVQKGSHLLIKEWYEMFGFRYHHKAKMIMSYNKYGRTEILKRSRNRAMIFKVCYIEATVEPYRYWDFH